MDIKNVGMVLLLLWGITSNLAFAQNQNSVEGDRQALVDLYHATNGDNWKNNSGWLNGNPSNNWYGVEVDASGRVIKVDLKNNNLQGTNGLPRSLGNMKKMRYFNVLWNNISGNLPEELFTECSNLVYLYLNFSDDIIGRDDDPHEHAQQGGGDVHGGKTETTTQQGSWNNFTGSIPSTFNLPDLEWFALSWSNITSYSLDGVSNSTKLIGLLTGANFDLIPNTVPASIGNLVNLEHLILSGSNKSWGGLGGWEGELPSEMSNMTSLKYVRLGSNEFTGVFPDLSGATNMHTFSAALNNWTSGFPTYALDGTWSNINSFALSYNDFSDASLPQNAPSSIRLLNVSSIGIEGGLPSGLFPVQIIVTNFSNNNLSGDSPSDLRHLTRIRNLRWKNNNLTGQWPDLDWTNQQGHSVDPLRNFTRAQFSHNHYVFADMLVVSDNGKTLFQWYSEEADKDFQYAPQKAFGSSRNENGGIIDFSEVVTHSDNVYTWYRNGNQISGESTNSIDASKYGLGTYKLEVTNPNVPDLTLQSVDIEVTDFDSGGSGSDGTSNPSESPALEFPADGGEDVSTTPEFKWSSVEGADYYIIHSNRLDPTEMVIEAEVQETSFVPNGGGLDTEATHHWRVRAVKDGVEGEWSPIWEFTTGSVESTDGLQVPTVPVLKTPADGATDQPLTLSLDWDAVDGANTYRVQVATDADFSSRIVEKTGLTGSAFEVTELSSESTYYWRVQAANGVGSSNWSKQRSFITGSGKSISVSTPALNYPVDKTTNVSLTPTLRWDASDADLYILSIYNSESPENVIEEEVLGTSYTIDKELDPETTYIWRVRAVKEGVQGDWSSEWNFTTGTGDQVEASLEQNYPNPFNPSTQIRFTLAETQRISLKVYDTTGRLVATLVEGTLNAGSHEQTFNANNLASGVYFLRFITENRILTSQMTLMK